MKWSGLKKYVVLPFDMKFLRTYADIPNKLTQTWNICGRTQKKTLHFYDSAYLRTKQHVEYMRTCAIYPNDTGMEYLRTYAEKKPLHFYDSAYLRTKQHVEYMRTCAICPNDTGMEYLRTCAKIIHAGSNILRIYAQNPSSDYVM